MKGHFQMLLTLGGVLLVLLACGAPTILPPRTLAKAPASALKVVMTVFGQFTPAYDPPSVQIEASFADPTGGFYLSGNQTMTCNGVKLASLGLRETSVPRQPAGGAYRCVYTDEQGHQTTLLVPVPQGSLMVTNLTPYAAVPIPTSAKHPVPTTPFSSPQRPPEYTSALTLHYRFPLWPQTATTTLVALCWWHHPGLGVGGEEEPATGVYTLSDAESAYGQGFESFQPGLGSVALDATSTWTASPGGFQAVQIKYIDGVAIPVMWTSG